jgi:hypothetical protein
METLRAASFQLPATVLPFLDITKRMNALGPRVGGLKIFYNPA